MALDYRVFLVVRGVSNPGRHAVGTVVLYGEHRAERWIVLNERSVSSPAATLIGVAWVLTRLRRPEHELMIALHDVNMCRAMTERRVDGPCAARLALVARLRARQRVRFEWIGTALVHPEMVRAAELAEGALRSVGLEPWKLRMAT